MSLPVNHLYQNFILYKRMKSWYKRSFFPTPMEIEEKRGVVTALSQFTYLPPCAVLCPRLCNKKSVVYWQSNYDDMFSSDFSFRALILHGWLLQVFTVEVTGHKLSWIYWQSKVPSMRSVQFFMLPMIPAFTIVLKNACLFVVCLWAAGAEGGSRECKIHGLAINVHALTT